MDNPTLYRPYSRTVPITPYECNFLLQLIKEEEIIEDKRTDGRIMALKKKAWSRVACKLNAKGHSARRSELQLRKIWERLKVKKKSEDYAIRKKEALKTGGGASPVNPPDASYKVLDIIDSEIDDIGCNYDCDSVQIGGATTTCNIEVDRVYPIDLPTMDHNYTLGNGTIPTKPAEELEPVCSRNSVEDPLQDSPVVDIPLQSNACAPSTSLEKERMSYDTDMYISPANLKKFTKCQEEAQRDQWARQKLLLDRQIEEADEQVKHAKLQCRLTSLKIQKTELEIEEMHMRLKTLSPTDTQLQV